MELDFDLDCPHIYSLNSDLLAQTEAWHFLFSATSQKKQNCKQSLLKDESRQFQSSSTHTIRQWHVHVGCWRGWKRCFWMAADGTVLRNKPVVSHEASRQPFPTLQYSYTVIKSAEMHYGPMITLYGTGHLCRLHYNKTECQLPLGLSTEVQLYTWFYFLLTSAV